VPAGNSMHTLCTPSVRLADVLNVMLYAAAAQAQFGATLTVTPLTAADTGVAITLRPKTRPRAIRILSIFLTSFLLSYYQAFPDFEAV
jgi:hypothetical protein